MSSNGWRQMTLGDFVRLQRGHDLPETRRKSGDVPVLGSFGITGYHSEAKAKGPGVTVGRSGASFGVVNYSPIDYWPLNTALYVTDFRGNDEKFVYYYLKSIDFSGYNSGSAQPSLNRNFIYNLQVEVPHPDEQRAIARILGALDDKIELNRQMNGTLEAMAQALFKSWFVDFDPVTAKAAGRKPYGMNEETAALFPDEFEDSAVGAIPRGWKLKPLDEIAHFENGLALQNFRPTGDEYLPVIKIRELRQGFSSSDSEKASPQIKASCIINDGDVIFSWSGSLLVEIWCGGKGALNQHLFKVTSAKYPKWFYYFWTKEHLEDFQGIASDKTTTMGHIQRHHLSSAQTVVPNNECLKRADVMIAPLIDTLVSNYVQSRTLASLRDALLPKLLSGEIRVRQAENFVAEAI